MFVLSGCNPSSTLKLSVPLYADRRCTGRVACSTKIPVLMLCGPRTLVRLPETFQSVLCRRTGNRRSYMMIGAYESRNPAAEAGVRQQVQRVRRPGRTAGNAGQHAGTRVRVERRLVQRRRVLVSPVHAGRRLDKRRRIDRVEQRVHVADRLGLELRGHPREEASESEGRRQAGPALVPELNAAVHGRPRTGIPIEPQHLVVAGPVVHRLERVVEPRRVRCVWQRKQVENRLPRLVDPVEPG